MEARVVDAVFPQLVRAFPTFTFFSKINALKFSLFPSACVAGARRGRGIGEIRRALERNGSA